MNVSLIIAAGGQGKRFQKGLKAKTRPNKLFLDLSGRPILSYTLDSFEVIPQIREILLAVPKGSEKWIRDHILKGRNGHVSIRLIQGGKTRAESVWNALRKTSPRSEWILVHDGARPFPPRKGILELFKRCTGLDGAILAKAVVPTLKKVSRQNNQIIGTVDRENLFEAETPQLIRKSSLIKAYQKNPKALLATDESSLIESLGGEMKVVSHSDWNVKITTPQDLHLAEAYLGKGSSSIAIGFGRDTHRLVPGRRFFLGGVRIPFEKGTLGHSDGDALLHAIADALLGALALGDIGDWFPPSNPRFKNVRSSKFVKKILQQVRKKGWQPDRVDTVILLERPKLASHKKKIQQEVAKLLGISVESVSIKAKTQEGLGPVGQGLAVTCEALALLRKVH
ncbi:MAG: 2-C-methyl-D-erythritol 4-phosphate cytidylyltransferase [Candidatus Omnitrophica bacterium]|nr:2-C-methyl-D-erythritol 4-phosphate cytidylyltransferase [Candidatus Omnitrophota bacterium]